ncbi:hypothetical protein B0H19DRAFT_1058304 [Mycena capillaripes]|nr:hypothetical protein B0H19DRAFT_1058304 [Mycena capillaripes]
MFATSASQLRACSKIVVRVVDYGRITCGRRGLLFWRKNSIFVREGNIYDDGKAAEQVPLNPRDTFGFRKWGDMTVTSNFFFENPPEFGGTALRPSEIAKKSTSDWDQRLISTPDYIAILFCADPATVATMSGLPDILALVHSLIMPKLAFRQSPSV